MEVPLTLQDSGAVYGVYVEDLTTGAWMGINERDKFVPASLLKVPSLVATLKNVQDGTLSFNQTVLLNEEDLNELSGSLYLKGAGYNITIAELLNWMITDSDNTALLTINRRIISEEDILDARLGLGIRTMLVENEELSPKEYANIFRSLYLSSYLRRSFSQYALSLMQKTHYESQLPAGLPPGVKIAHKVGLYTTKGYYHDCGIVYLPEKPYLICVMSMNTTKERADAIISQISRETYLFMSTSVAEENANK